MRRDQSPRLWTRAEDDLLRKHWAEGRSASWIAVELSRETKNMVIGRVHRLKLPKRVSPYSQRVRHVATKPRATKPKVTLVLPKVKQLRQLAERMKADLPPEAKPMAHIPFNDEQHEGFRLIDLPDNGCRYIVNNAAPGELHLYCGGDQHGGSPYCKDHHAIVWKPRGKPQHFRLQIRSVAA